MDKLLTRERGNRLRKVISNELRLVGPLKYTSNNCNREFRSFFVEIVDKDCEPTNLPQVVERYRNVLNYEILPIAERAIKFRMYSVTSLE